MDWVLAGCRKMGSVVVGTMRECWEQMVGGRGGGRDGAQGGEQAEWEGALREFCLFRLLDLGGLN